MATRYLTPEDLREPSDQTYPAAEVRRSLLYERAKSFLNGIIVGMVVGGGLVLLVMIHVLT